jgi:2-keto-3-deoxy-L-rhamnonate aldolase RhmA
MVPLVNNRVDAEQAVSYCLFPPQGVRSAAYPVRAVYPKGVGAAGLSRYLQEANKDIEVWLQVRGTRGGGGGGAPQAAHCWRLQRAGRTRARHVPCSTVATRVPRQVETKSCLESIDDVLSVPGITCAFLGG